MQYCHTRLVRLHILGLCLLLIVTAVLSEPSLLSRVRLPVAAGVTLLAILAFWHWDDIADLPYDRIHHAGRVLVRSGVPWPLIFGLVAGLISVAILLRHDSARLSVFLLYIVLLAFLYHTGPGGRIDRPMRVAIVLTKYPLFLFLLLSSSRRAWMAGVVLFLILAAYEWHSDAAIRRAAIPQLSIAAASGVAIVTSMYFSTGVWS
jgi:4-hydroxybenzoate polyprenyltransferase